MLAGPGPRLIDLGNPIADHPLNRGLVGWFLPLPHTFGAGRLFDLCKPIRQPAFINGPTLQASSPVTISRPLKFASASSQYAFSADYFPALNNTTRASVAAWVNPATVPATGSGNLVVFSQKGSGAYNSANDTFELALRDSNTQAWYFEIGNAGGGGGWKDAASTAVAQVGLWQYVMGTYDGANLKLYVNGVLLGTTACTQSSGTQTGGFNIGRSNLNSGSDPRYFDGSVVDLRVWDRPLSASDAAACYDQSRRHLDTLRRYTPATWQRTAPTAGAPATTYPNLLLLGVG